MVRGGAAGVAGRDDEVVDEVLQRGLDDNAPRRARRLRVHEAAGPERPVRDVLGGPRQRERTAGAPPQANDRAAFAQNVLRNIQGFSNLKMLSQDNIRVGGQPTHEIRLEGQTAGDNTDVVIVQWMRFGVAGFIRVVGISPKASWPDNFTRFRQVRDGINARE